MNEMKAPGWLRALDIVFGLIAVILSVVVLAYQELAILTMIFVLSIVLLVVGIARIFGGIFATYLSGGMRAVNVGIGILALVLGAIALVYTDLTTQVMIYILSFALLLNGIARLVIGGFASLPKVASRFFCDCWITYYRIVCVRFCVSWVGLSSSGSDAFFHVSIQWNSEDCSRNSRHTRNRVVALTKRKKEAKTVHGLFRLVRARIELEI